MENAIDRDKPGQSSPLAASYVLPIAAQVSQARVLSGYYVWSKEFLEAGKRRLAGDTARAATTDEVKDLRRESSALKEVVAEQALELRLLKKSMIAGGGDAE